MSESQVRIVSVLPDLLGTYGDTGNVLVLERRLAWRGVACEVVVVRDGAPLPTSGDLYVLGGGEDRAQSAAAALLRGSGLARAVGDGAQVFAVCAGMQLLGNFFEVPSGEQVPGLGLLDITTGRLERRAVGEVLARPDSTLGLPMLTGFANHSGRTLLGPAAAPLATVVTGTGNGGPDGSEGVQQGRILGTYLHGPVLARNPTLADLLLRRVVGAPLGPLDDAAADSARRQRLGRHGGRAPRRLTTHPRPAATG